VRTSAEILTAIQANLPQAVAIHKLRSGDIDIRLASQSHRDAVVAASDPQGIHILRKDLLIELLSVPYTTLIKNERLADNTLVIQAIERESYRLCGSVKLTSIR